MKGSGKSQTSKSDGHEAMVADHESLQEEAHGVSHEAQELRGKFDEVFFAEDSLEQLEALMVDSAVEKGGPQVFQCFPKFSRTILVAQTVMARRHTCARAAMCAVCSVMQCQILLVVEPWWVKSL